MFAGVARPPRPKAASPAKGLLPSLPICNNDEEIHRSNIKSRGQRIVTLGVCLKEKRVYDDTEKCIYCLNLSPRSRARIFDCEQELFGSEEGRLTERDRWVLRGKGGGRTPSSARSLRFVDHLVPSYWRARNSVVVSHPSRRTLIDGVVPTSWDRSDGLFETALSTENHLSVHFFNYVNPEKRI